MTPRRIRKVSGEAMDRRLAQESSKSHCGAGETARGFQKGGRYEGKEASPAASCFGSHTHCPGNAGAISGGFQPGWWLQCQGKLVQRHLVVRQRQWCWAGMWRHSKQRLHLKCCWLQRRTVEKPGHPLHSLVSQGEPPPSREGRGSQLHPLMWIADGNKILCSKKKNKGSKDTPKLFSYCSFFLVSYRECQLLEALLVELRNAT